MTRQRAIANVLAAARADKGLREAPPRSNDHPRIRKALALCGLGPRYRYCAAMLALWGTEALGDAWPLPRTADCDVLLAFARRRKVLHASPAVGDVFLLLRPSDSDDAFHTGLVTDVQPNGRFETWEANTNPGGSADGDGVYARERSDTAHIVFVRWASLLDDDDDEPSLAATWKLFVGTSNPRELALWLRQGVGYCRLRALLTVLHGEGPVEMHLGWDEETSQPTWHGEPLPSEVRQCRDERGDTWVAVADGAPWQGLVVKRDAANKLIRVVRG